MSNYQQKGRKRTKHLTNCWMNKTNKDGEKLETPYIESAALTEEDIDKLAPGSRIRVYPIDYPRKGADGKMIHRKERSPTHRLVIYVYRKN